MITLDGCVNNKDLKNDMEFHIIWNSIGSVDNSPSYRRLPNPHYAFDNIEGAKNLRLGLADIFGPDNKFFVMTHYVEVPKFFGNVGGLSVFTGTPQGSDISLDCYHNIDLTENTEFHIIWNTAGRRSSRGLLPNPTAACVSYDQALQTAAHFNSFWSPDKFVVMSHLAV
jgi:hypothetical protein